MTLGVEDLLAAGLPGAQLLAFHEAPHISWDEASGTGRVEAVRRNALDDWFYGCHFLGDPVMPGCWGIDAVWQCLRLFASWRGLRGCDKVLGMDDVRFSGQIRPRDKEVRYLVDVVSVESGGGDTLVTGKAAVLVDGSPVYSVGSAQIGSDYWQQDSQPEAPPTPAAPEAVLRRLTYDKFSAKTGFSHGELIALSQGTLIDAPGVEVGLLPGCPMLEVSEVHHISYDEASGQGRIIASKRNSPLDWFYPLTQGEKPVALTVDAVWQLLGLFLAWRRNPGTGRALGFEKVEVFGPVTPKDRRVVYDLRVSRAWRNEAAGDAYARADAKVFAGGRLVLSAANAQVGCHKDIRYSDYPLPGPRAGGTGG